MVKGKFILAKEKEKALKLHNRTILIDSSKRHFVVHPFTKLQNLSKIKKLSSRDAFDYDFNGLEVCDSNKT